MSVYVGGLLGGILRQEVSELSFIFLGADATDQFLDCSQATQIPVGRQVRVLIESMGQRQYFAALG